MQSLYQNNWAYNCHKGSFENRMRGSNGKQMNEQSLQEFYSDLINCKMIAESANIAHLLNPMATSERIFSRLPWNLQEKFAESALKKSYDIDVVPFDLFAEVINHL